MAEVHRRFDGVIVLRAIFDDDLGHLYRAAGIDGDALADDLWLRVLDGAGVPKAAVAAAFDEARQIAASLRNPQLPGEPIFVVDDGVPALGCEFTVGQPLNRVLARARDEAFPLQPENALLIAEKIARGLAAAQEIKVGERPLSHGFLHPGLILLSGDGEAVVTGVGIGEALLGGRDAFVGARAYLAPEVLAGGSPSHAADVYSVGAILFHLLTGTALPAEPGDRAAALDSAYLAWDGEPMPSDVEPLLAGTLEPDPARRVPSAAKLCPEIENLIYGGAYSPTTFNLALFMDRLFREDFDADEVARADEREIDFAPIISPPAEAEEPAPPDSAAVPRIEAPPEAKPAETRRGNAKGVWALVGTGVIIAVAAGLLWFFGRGDATPTTPPAEPTPTAAQVAASREAQEERLRMMTQEMVQQMMAEKEAEIRQELMARQSRIEELQKRLQASERRAARDTATARNEAETQKALLAEIEAEEEAQRALNEEVREAAAAAAAVATTPTGEPVADTSAADDPGAASPQPDPTATSPPPTRPPTPAPTETDRPAVVRGSFVEPDDVDSRPVVLKNQPLTWPRGALRSGKKGTVVVQVTVNATGGVDGVEVLRSDDTGYGIPEAAAEAASGCRFKPAMKDGVPVTTHAFITWRYDFSDR